MSTVSPKQTHTRPHWLSPTYFLDMKLQMSLFESRINHANACLLAQKIKLRKKPKHSPSDVFERKKKKKKDYEETSRALEMETNACKINSSSYPETTPPKRAAKGQNGNAPTKRSGGGVRCSHPLVTFLDHLNQSSRAHSKPPTGPSLAGQRCWC